MLDPMCGSGTIPIEAALIASGISPGKFRDYFGFMRWKDYDKNLFEQLKRDCELKKIRPDIKISGSDISEEAVLQSGKNIESAGLSDIITVGLSDFRNIKATGTSGYIIMNPPYGQRLEAKNQDEIYGMIGSVLKT